MPNQTTFSTSRGRTMKALVIYDDLASGKQAVAELKRAANRSKIAIRWDLKPWRLDILSKRLS